MYVVGNNLSLSFWLISQVQDADKLFKIDGGSRLLCLFLYSFSSLWRILLFGNGPKQSNHADSHQDLHRKTAKGSVIVNVIAAV